MKYLRFGFKTKSKKKVTIEIDKPAVVMVMTGQNFKRYQNGNRCIFLGGKVKNSPFELTVPGNNIYHVVIELGNHTKEEINPRIKLENPQRQVNPDIEALEQILNREEA